MHRFFHFVNLIRAIRYNDITGNFCKVDRKRRIKRAKNEESNNGNVEKAKKESSVVEGTKVLPSGHVSLILFIRPHSLFYLTAKRHNTEFLYEIEQFKQPQNSVNDLLLLF